MRLLVFATLLTVPLLTTIRVHADDAALAELKVAYELKQSGNCRDALPHFMTSYRLHATAKAILNASDCEQRLDNVVAAHEHATEGLALAERDGETELVAVAHGQLTTIDKRVARLTPVVTGAVPATVSIDGATVWQPGVPALLNPGSHSILVSAPGYADRTYPVSLAEGANERVEVTVGDALGRPKEKARNQVADAVLAPASLPPERAIATSMSTRRVIALTLGGVGLVALGVGGGFGIAAISKNADSNANGHCDATTGCDPTGVSLRNTALNDATISTVSVGVGLAAISGGLALFLTEPRATATASANVELAPLVTPSSGGMTLRGTW